MATADSVNALYLSILGRPADSAGLASAVAAINAGLPVAAFAASLAASPEAQADIATIYQNDLGRAPDAAGDASFTRFLANGGSLSGTEASIANSSEAQADISTIFQAELGRTPDYLDVSGFAGALAAGSSLAIIRASIAASPEAQSDLNGLYVTELGRTADSVGLASFTQSLANGASLSIVKAVLAASPEAAAKISSVYQADAGHAPNAIALAGEQSELQSGIPLTTIETEMGELAGGSPPSNASTMTTPSNPFLTITPETIGGSTPMFAYSLGNDVTLASPSSSEKVMTLGGSDSEPMVTGFDPATDIIQIPTQIVPNYTDLQLSSSPTSDTFFAGHSLITLNGVPHTSLTPANFQFV